MKNQDTCSFEKGIVIDQKRAIYDITNSMKTARGQVIFLSDTLL